MFPFPFSFFGAAAADVPLELIDNNFAMEFDGTDEYVETNHNNIFDFGTSDFAISAWVKTTGTTSQHRTVVCKQNPESSGQWSLQVNTNGVVNFYANNGAIDVVSTTTVNDGNWHNILIQRTLAVFNVYIDKPLRDTETAAGQVLNNTQNLRIGRRATGYDAYFIGDIDEVAIWNKALALEDVQTIYNATNDNPGKCANLFTGGLKNGLQYWNRMGDN